MLHLSFYILPFNKNPIAYNNNNYYKMWPVDECIPLNFSLRNKNQLALILQIICSAQYGSPSISRAWLATHFVATGHITNHVANEHQKKWPKIYKFGVTLWSTPSCSRPMKPCFVLTLAHMWPALSSKLGNKSHVRVSHFTSSWNQQYKHFMDRDNHLEQYFFNVSSTCYCKKWYITEPHKIHVTKYILILFICCHIDSSYSKGKMRHLYLKLVPWFVGAGHIWGWWAKGCQFTVLRIHMYKLTDKNSHIEASSNIIQQHCTAPL